MTNAAPLSPRTPPARAPLTPSEPAERSALFPGGLVLLLVLTAAARASAPGTQRLGLAAAGVALAALTALRLPLARRLTLLAAAALAVRTALPAAEAPTSSPADLLRQAGYYALPPLLAHLVLAWRGLRPADFGLTVAHLYAPMLPAFLALSGYEAYAGAEAPGATAARTLYGVVYAALLLLLLLREVHTAGERPAPRLDERADALAEEGRFGVAQRYYAQGARLDKAAEMAERAGEWERAAELYSRTGDPYRAAEMACRAGRFETALEHYEAARAFDAAARVAERLGRAPRAAELYEEAGDIASAVRVLESAGRPVGGDLYARADQLEKAVVAWQNEGRADRAAEVLEEDFADLPGAAQVYRNAGLYQRAAELFERAGDRHAAVDAWLAAPDGRLEAVRVCLELGDVVRAGEIAAALPPETIEQADDERTLLMLARIEEQTGRLDEALRHLQKLRRRSDPPPEVFLPLGRCLHARGLVELAEENLRTAVEVQLGGPDALEAAYLLGCVLEERGKTEEAAEVFLELMRKDLGYSDAEDRYRRLKGTPA